MLDQLLERYNLKYEDLNSAEKETLQTWLSALDQNQISVEKIKDYITSMLDSVENDLETTENGTKKDLFLKARLRNYRLLRAFLTSPERARVQIENALSGIASR